MSTPPCSYSHWGKSGTFGFPLWPLLPEDSICQQGFEQAWCTLNINLGNIKSLWGGHWKIKGSNRKWTHTQKWTILTGCWAGKLILKSRNPSLTFTIYKPPCRFIVQALTSSGLVHPTSATSQGNKEECAFINLGIHMPASAKCGSFTNGPLKHSFIMTHKEAKHLGQNQNLKIWSQGICILKIFIDLKGRMGLIARNLSSFPITSF